MNANMPSIAVISARLAPGKTISPVTSRVCAVVNRDEVGTRAAHSARPYGVCGVDLRTLVRNQEGRRIARLQLSLDLAAIAADVAQLDAIARVVQEGPAGRILRGKLLDPQRGIRRQRVRESGRAAAADAAPAVNAAHIRTGNARNVLMSFIPSCFSSAGARRPARQSVRQRRPAEYSAPRRGIFRA